MRTFLRVASALGMGLGTILFVIGLVSLKEGGAAFIGVGFGSMVSCALIWLLVDIANAVDDIARIRPAIGTQIPVEPAQQGSVSGWYQAPPPRKPADE